MHYVYSRPNGGHYLHARPIEADGFASPRAICGYQPGSPRVKNMTPRGYWASSFRHGDPRQGRPPAGWICPRCVRILTRLGVLSS